MNDKIALSSPLSIAEIDFRVQSVSKTGWAVILPYKDARVDMNRLDAVYGVEGWQRKHEFKDGKLFCSIGVWSQDKLQWIWKEDVGVESNNEAEKGQASDSFKRAGFNWGIGRELYSWPTIIVQLWQDEYLVEGNKTKATYNLKLKQWQWQLSRDGSGVLNGLRARDQNRKMRYAWGTYAIQSESTGEKR